jgi:hypothetical protein
MTTSICMQKQKTPIGSLRNIQAAGADKSAGNAIEVSDYLLRLVISAMLLLTSSRLPSISFLPTAFSCIGLVF